MILFMHIVHFNIENPTQQMTLDFEREFISPAASTRNLTLTKFPPSKFVCQVSDYKNLKVSKCFSMS